MQFIDMANQLKQAGNHSAAAQLIELYEKVQSGRLDIAFCGHFSAGKSSLINALSGTRLLPSSPIPTSANVVSISKGQPSAIVWLKGLDGHVDTREVALAELDAFCRNSDDVVKVSIHYPIERLQEQTVWLDTPGVDSTDAAHARATESALHLADAVLYVMDYNHVQSETNFAFARELEERGKPLFLIVNQIDKHRESEIPFETFAEGVRKAFADWHIQPLDFFFLSLKQPDHPHNEWHRLTAMLEQLQQHRDVLIKRNVIASAKHLIGMHKQQRLLEQEEMREKLRDAADAGHELSPDMRHELEEAGRLRTDLDTKPASWKQELGKLLDFANITPAETRELARLMIESRQSGFRMGWLFAGGKTEQERKARLQTFADKFAEDIESQIVWHLRSWLNELAERELADGAGTDWGGDISLRLEPDWLADAVRDQATVTGEYVLNYMRDIAAEVKSRFRRQALDVMEKIEEKWRSALQVRLTQLDDELEQVRQAEAAQAELAELDAGLDREEQALLEQLPPMPPLPEIAQDAVEGSEEEAVPALFQQHADAHARQSASAMAQAAAASAAAGGIAPSEQIGGTASSARTSNAPESLAESGGKLQDRAKAAAKLLEAAAAEAELYPAFRHTVKELRERAKRLRERRFSLALFGAFSAGKSSFANALMGGPLLPVSPNPTTAAINRILPAEEERPHGSARILMKPQATLWEDMQHSMQALGLTAAAPEEAIHRIRQVRPDNVRPKGKPHLAFLTAVASGWERNADLLGRTLDADMETFRRYAAVESDSCFVERIDLYVDAPLTRSGMMLVDTPGADSINARHTGVAFHYMKNADAIIFITYYNHAFSLADREFLRQLGQVKDSFDMDKMFFVINAADLAENAQELEDVAAHLADNLNRFEIREPRLYPVSSLNALEAKLSQDADKLEQSGWARLERELSRFGLEELSELAVQNAVQEVQQVIRTLNEWERIATADQAEREQEEQRRQQAWRDWLAELEQLSGQSKEKQALQQEIRELVYYVKQRHAFRFGEWMQEAFNPASLRGDVRSVKEALAECWFEFVQLIDNHLSREMQATTLRIERILRQLLAGLWEEWRRQFTIRFPSAAIPDYETDMPPTPVIEETAGWNKPDLARLQSLFKNAKHYFEGNGRTNMREWLESVVTPQAEAYLQAHEERLLAYYERHWEQLCDQASRRCLELAEAYQAGTESLPHDDQSLSKLRATRDRLQQELVRFAG
ncbi:hypothetical protein DUZ99_11155 [Xylanibacillus composti]|uniref:Dynamin N-terminal domain-containing protein n=1 Tax=Xylanibacillus composti TaxID=1572762 RepID=A0A8J4GYM5_9BACL|nr:dynamin family protein [Xylanibacillus composti]MDT9725528.1 hypothetical protein [Xylanibacillus composti]GIQ67622.1 hypothetical protein XYCOK13_04460 [Xylanibacillus composti]